MPVTLLCPHCSYEFQVPARRPDGAVLCEICGQAFNLTAAEVAALIAEVERIEAAEAAAAAAAEAEAARATPTPTPEEVPQETDAEEPADEDTSAAEVDTVEVDRPARRRKRRKPDPDEAEAKNPWAEYGVACHTVCLGVATEIAAFTALIVIQLVFTPLMVDAGRSSLEGMHLGLTVLSVLVVALGSGVVAAGRMEQANVPEDRMDQTPLTTVALVGWLGVLATVVAAVVVGVNRETWLSGRRGDPAGQIVILALLTACWCRMCADVGAFVNLGLVGGAMPSRTLRDGVASANVGSQVLGVCCLGLVFAGVLAPASTSRGPNTDLNLIMVAGTYFIALLYGILSFKVNATAQRAAETWVPDQYE